MLTQGLEVRAAVDEVDVGAGLGEPTPEIAPDPAGAVNRDPHGFTLPSSGHYRPLLVAGCVLNDDPASDLPDRDRCTPHLSQQTSAALGSADPPAADPARSPALQYRPEVVLVSEL